MPQLLFKEESYQIVGACFEVYNYLGHGLLEAVYQEALEIELSHRGIDYLSQPKLKIHYKDRTLKQYFTPDLLCLNNIIIEIKSGKALDDSHRAQIMNYLRLSKKKLGILINFGSHPDLQHERFAL